MPSTPPRADRPDRPDRRAGRALAAASWCVVALAVVVGGCGSSGGSDASGRASSTTVPASASASTGTAITTASGEPVVKDVLAADVDPPGAPGYTLTLIRYTIAPGAQLAPHVHPGVQMAEIDSGTLSYTVVSGTAQVRRDGAEPRPVTGPAEISLGPGDSVVEPFDMVHYGANDTEEPVIITATLLTESDQGLSVAVTTTTAAP